MGFTHPISLRSLAIFAAALVAASVIAVVPPALADTSPPAGTPTTASTDPLPAPQINAANNSAIVWSQVIVGNTVYAGGNFTSARPSGAAAGVSEVSRTNLLSYDVTTGVLNSNFAPTFNGVVRVVAASPDGTRLYVGGDFTAVNGQNRYRVAAFDTATGTLIANFKPVANTRVTAIAATNQTVYLGGWFTTMSSLARPYGAAISVSSGAVLPFAPQFAGGTVAAVIISPDQSKVVYGGSFTTTNGSGNPGYGLAAVDSNTGATLPFAVNNDVRNGGPNAGITSLSGDGDSVYGTGYVFGSGGNLEGTFRASWADGSITWIEDCHGDSYSAVPIGDVVYVASHEHYCGNIGGFPQTDPWTTQRGTAFTKDAKTTITADPYGYYNWAGKPAPQWLDFWPDFSTGKASGAGQAAWSVTGNAKYVVFGGEFPTVNNKAQYGLARFAVPAIAPNKDGPRLSGANFVPSVVSLSSGTVRVSWPANYDRDNATLKYDLIRDGRSATPIFSTTVVSHNWFIRPVTTYQDVNLAPGSTHTYQLRATDPFGNVAFGAAVSATVTSVVTSDYGKKVLSDGASSFWRLGEGSGAAVYDWAGSQDLVATATVARGAGGAIAGDANGASTFNGKDSLAVAQTAIPAPNTFGLEAWFNTTSTTGGKIVGFGNSKTQYSSSYDRHVFMDASGHVVFGVYPGTARTLQSANTYNDGQWHQVVANLSASGMQLYVDGVKVGARTDTTTGQDYQGYWRIGGDQSWSGNPYFAGQIDDVSLYGAPLSLATVDTHYELSGRTNPTPSAPADAYGARVFADSPDLYWRLGESSGTTAKDSGPSNNPGVYSGGVTEQTGGAISGTTDTAATFNGVDGLVSSLNMFSDPEVYTEELWFSSTSAVGGKLIGFGSANSGTSNNYDRHIYLQDNGQIVFGTYTGQLNTVTTPLSYNDGKWHQVAASQSSDGLKLYVDGALIGTNPTTSAQNYSGYWRVGGDNTWGSSSAYIAAKIDEVAVYGTALSASTIAAHYQLGAGTMTNVAPTAAFTTTTSNLALTADAGTSTDQDGTITSYSWTFGDGATATGITTSHTYPAAGSYPVSLTVTDNSGATNSTTAQVIVSRANVAPTAAFTTTTSNLALTADAGTSTDQDGTITSYSWTFGDGATATGITTSHTYPAAGSYPVSLTVTDNSGATNSTTAQVIVTAAGTTPLAQDGFARSSGAGWGAADIGGNWTVAGAATNYTVGSGVGRQSLVAGQTLTSTLGPVSTTRSDLSFQFGFDKAPTGGGVYVVGIGRQVGANTYAAKVKVAASGVPTLQLIQGGTVLGTYSVPGLVYTVGDTWQLHLTVTGTTPTTLHATLWKAGTTEPAAWQLTATDSTAALQLPGAIALQSYLSGTATNAPFGVRFDNLVVNSAP